MWFDEESHICLTPMPDACNGDEVIDLFWLTVDGDLSQFADSSTHPVVHFAQILTTIFP